MTLGKATRVLSCAHALSFLFPPQFLDDRARGAACWPELGTHKASRPAPRPSVQAASGPPSSPRRAAQPQLPWQLARNRQDLVSECQQPRTLLPTWDHPGKAWCALLRGCPASGKLVPSLRGAHLGRPLPTHRGGALATAALRTQAQLTPLPTAPRGPGPSGVSPRRGTRRHHRAAPVARTKLALCPSGPGIRDTTLSLCRRHGSARPPPAHKPLFRDDHSGGSSRHPFRM